MRLFCLLLSFFCVLTLAACGTEEELTPPSFSQVRVNGEEIKSPYSASSVTITGNIDDFAATIVANSMVTGEVSIPVDSSDGSWSYSLTLQAGANVISFVATDKRGNLNQLVLNLLYEPVITE